MPIAFRAARGDSHRSPIARAGFTLLEVMIVLAIIVIIIGMAAGRYQQSLVKAKEGVLHQDLRVMREAIQQYTLDKQAAPQSLDDLVSAGYMRDVPTDPMTQRKDWQVVNEDILLSPDQTATGITDVHSSSNSVSPFENTPYSSW
ncbi:MAG TPA: prepilin-type N-terminal cleavage/methylation domain-containing protein [Candidatus Acidoferrales bacterium]|nr:prepilin-type N-terminal cleavage/methylation domain-containing protein [Candidatus Acidoferrales bacterium]